jgi:hypothetical protein
MKGGCNPYFEGSNNITVLAHGRLLNSFGSEEDSIAEVADLR